MKVLISSLVLLMTSTVCYASPTYSTRVEAVNLAVTATSQNQRFISGLKVTDFKVYEDGVEQEIKLFGEDQVPLTLLILIDSSLSMTGAKIEMTKQAAIRLIKSLKPEDEAQVVAFNDTASFSDSFTSNQQELTSSVTSIVPGGATALNRSLYIALKTLSKKKKTDGEQLRRRAIVVLTDGMDTSGQVTEDDIILTSNKSGFGIFGIQLGNFTDDEKKANPNAKYFLKNISESSGSEYYFVDTKKQDRDGNKQEKLNKVYDHIAETLRHQYSLGYVSTSTSPPSKLRRLQVLVNSGAGTVLKYRTGYQP